MDNTPEFQSEASVSVLNTSDSPKSDGEGARIASLDRITVIVPVRNEEAAIDQLLHGLLQQTVKPEEVVIVDGGSTDNTKELIRKAKLSFPIPIVLIESEHALPGRGRNLAIAGARNEWLVCLDAGIVPRSNWIAELIASARRAPTAQVIYGRFEPVTDTYFTECAAITYVNPAADARSITSCLLRRDAWRAAGGFREDLRSGEDLLFFRSLDKAAIESAHSEKALVEWQLQSSIGSTFRRFAVYARNNLKAGLGREWQRNVIRFYALLFLSLIAGFWFWPFFLIAPVLLLMRAERRVWNWFKAKAPRRLWREVLNPARVLTVLGINLVIDAAMFYGSALWLLKDRVTSVSGSELVKK